MKKFSEFMTENTKTYADVLGSSKRMQEKTPHNDMEMHFAKHNLVVQRAQPIKGGHRFTVLPHFGDDNRSKATVQKNVNNSISTSPHKATHHSYTMVGPEELGNHIHKIDVHYNN